MPQLISLLMVLLLATPMMADPLEEMVDRAIVLSDGGHHREAADLWLKRAELAPENSEERALILWQGFKDYFQAGQNGEANSTVLALEPLHRCIAIYQLLGRPKDVLRMELQSGSVFIELERWDEATSALQRSLELARTLPDGRLYRYRALRYLTVVRERQDNYWEALDTQLEALDLVESEAPDEKGIMQATTGRLYFTLGEWEKSTEHLQKALLLASPEQLGEWELDLAQALTAQGNYADALPILVRREKSATTPESKQIVRYRLADNLLRSKQLDLVEQWLQKMAPTEFTTLVLRLRYLGSVGKRDEALELLLSDAFLDEEQRFTAISLQHDSNLLTAYLKQVESPRPRHYQVYSKQLLEFGDVQAAASVAQNGLEAFEGPPNSVSAGLNVNLAEALLLSNRAEQGLAQLETAWAWYEQNGSETSRALCLNNMAACLDSLGRGAEAWQKLEQAEKLLTERKDAALYATLLNAMGVNALKTESYLVAESYFQRAVNLGKLQHDTRKQATALFNLSQCQRAMGQTQTSWNTLKKVLRLTEDPRTGVLRPSVLTYLADTEPKPEVAARYLQEAIELTNLSGDRAVNSRAKARLAKLALDNGEVKRAQELAQDLLAKIDQPQPLAVLTSAHGVLAQISLERGQVEEALGHFEKLLVPLQVSFRGLSKNEVKLSVKPLEKLGRALVSALVIENRIQKAFELEEKIRSLSLQSIAHGVNLASARVPQELRTKQQSLDWRLKDLYLSEADTTRVSERALVLEYEQVLDRIERYHAAEGLLAQVSSVSIDEVQRVLNHDEAILEYLGDEQNLYLIVVTSQTLRAYDLKNAETIADLANQTRRGILRSKPLAELNPLLEELGTKILSQPLRELEGVSKLVFIPSEPLLNFPFAALRIGDRFVIDDYQVSRATSSSAWMLSRTVQVRGKGTAIGALGDTEPSSFGTVNFDSLPASKDEAIAVNGLFPKAQVLVGPQLLSKELARISFGRRNLHYATHAYLNPQDPFLSGLVTADGTITAADVLTWPLDTELVVLSACGTGQSVEGKGLVGLTSAFQYAGARTMVSSLWSVSDESTAYWMTQFYGALEEGLDSGAAVQKAHQKTKHKFFHPYYWAPFVLWGDGYPKP